MDRGAGESAWCEVPWVGIGTALEGVLDFDLLGENVRAERQAKRMKSSSERLSERSVLRASKLLKLPAVMIVQPSIQPEVQPEVYSKAGPQAHMFRLKESH